jgi:two-component system response regulator WspF
MRIAIVNDVVMAVEAVRRVLHRSGQHEIAWIARDGEEAVMKCQKDTPDLILMDLYMPRMGGAEATRRIMARTPCAIVVVTGDVEHNASAVFEAMGAGALDAVNTPVLDDMGPSGAAPLLNKVETIRRLLGTGTSKPTSTKPAGVRSVSPPTMIVVGASAGGPAALGKVLSSLPAGFPASLVVVQHVDAQFAESLARWLNDQTALEVRLAREGDRPEPGVVLLAGTEDHLVFLSTGRLAYTPQPEDCSYRPSVDVFMRSADRYWPGNMIGVLLTGMGRDGAEGLRLLRDHGHHTIAQDEASSAVFGMPKAAAQLGAAREVLPLDQIAPRLRCLVPRPMLTHA